MIQLICVFVFFKQLQNYTIFFPNFTAYVYQIHFEQKNYYEHVFAAGPFRKTRERGLRLSGRRRDSGANPPKRPSAAPEKKKSNGPIKNAYKTISAPPVKEALPGGGDGQDQKRSDAGVNVIPRSNPPGRSRSCLDPGVTSR